MTWHDTSDICYKFRSSRKTGKNNAETAFLCSILIELSPYPLMPSHLHSKFYFYQLKELIELLKIVSFVRTTIAVLVLEIVSSDGSSHFGWFLIKYSPK